MEKNDNSKKTKKIFWVFLVVLLSSMNILSSYTSVYAQSKWPDMGELVKLEKGYPYASSLDLFHKASDILSARDREAFLKLMLTGQVGLTVEGDTAYFQGMEGGGWLPSGIVKIRFKGSTETYFTNCEAVGIR